MRVSLVTLALVCLAEQIAEVSGKIHISQTADLALHHALGGRRSRILRHVDLTRASLSPRSPGAQPATSATTDAPGASSSAVPVKTGSMPADNAIQVACVQALTAMNGMISSPSGMTVCYNINFFDNSTGSFQASLMLYQVTDPIGDWATVSTNSTSMSLQYPGARVAPASTTTPSRRAIETRRRINARGELVGRFNIPQLVSDMSFVGQLDDSTLLNGMNTSAIEFALSPQVTLTATNSAGTKLSTQLSNKAASFVNGIFSNPAQLAANQAAAKAAIPFVLPGTTLGITPIGLYITSVWTFLFIGAVGYGTVGKVRFREAYRRKTRATGGFLGGKPPVAGYDNWRF